MLPLDINQNKAFASDFSDQYIKILKTARNKVINHGITVIINEVKKKIHIPYDDKKYWKKRLSDKSLKRIIVLTPSRQRKILNILKESKNLGSIHDKKTNSYQILKYIFTTCGYNNLNTKEKKLFYKNSKINTCIYCNRNYIFDVEENGHIKGHIDHFYPKGKYPYFAMSYFNFIPVCESCNKVKGELDTTDIEKKFIHPYDREEEKVIGTTLNTVTSLSYAFVEDDLLKKLHIEKIYNEGHTDLLQELYIKFFQQDTKEHFKSLGKSLNKIGFSTDEIHRFITSGYLEYEKQHKRSLSKAIKDIRDEFESV